MKRAIKTILALASLAVWGHLAPFGGSPVDILSALAEVRQAEAVDLYQAEGDPDGAGSGFDKTLDPGAVGLWETAADDTLLFADVGDTLHIEAYVNVGAQQANGFELFLTYHAQYLKPIDQSTRAGLQPFASDGLLPNATVLINSVIDLPDTVLSHIRYAEVSLSATVTDTGTVADLEFVVIRPIPGDSTAFVASENDTLSKRVTSFTDPTGASNALVPRNRVWVRNRPPVLRAPAELSMVEDDSLTLDLDSLVVDPEYSPEDMSWEISVVMVGGFQIRILKEDMQRLVLLPPQNWNGEGTLLFVVADPNGVSASGASHLTVAPVNDAPVLSSFLAEGLEIREDQSYIASLDTIVSDPDDDATALAWSFTGSGEITAEVDTSSGVLTLTPLPDWSGRDTLLVVVSDISGDSSEVLVPIRVDAVNDPPVFLSQLPEIKVSRDTVVDLSEFVSDADDSLSALSWWVQGAQALTIGFGPGGRLSVGVPDGWSGTEDLIIQVEDPQGLRALTGLALRSVPPALPADFDGSGMVDFSDFVLFAQSFGKNLDQEGYDAKFDLDGSGRIDFQDFVEFASSFGQGA